MIDLSKHIQEGARLELEALELSTDECSFMSAQNSAQAMQIDELKRDLAAAQDRAERTEVWAHGLEADMDKLREELAAAQSENAKLKAEITRVMQAAANGGYCRRNHAKCECENIAESIRTDE